MARSNIQVELELDTIFVHDEGDGWGDAEPYLWTVFFKVDGDTVMVTDSFTLSGPPTIQMKVRPSSSRPSSANGRRR